MGHPRARRELGGVARRRRLGAVRTVWHDDGRMMATWFQGPAEDFIAVSREGFDAGVRILHFLGGSSVDVAGERAIAQTKMTISQRATVHGVVSTSSAPAASTTSSSGGGPLGARAAPADLRERPPRPGRSRRRGELDAALLARFPEGYRHLAYLQTRIGYDGQGGHARPRGARRSRRSTPAGRAGCRAQPRTEGSSQLRRG